MSFYFFKVIFNIVLFFYYCSSIISFFKFIFNICFFLLVFGPPSAVRRPPSAFAVRIRTLQSPYDSSYTPEFNSTLTRSLSPGQTIATCQRNISQRCWAQHVAWIWPQCSNMLGVVSSSLKMVKFELTTPNTSQHVATGWPNARNMLRPTML